MLYLVRKHWKFLLIVFPVTPIILFGFLCGNALARLIDYYGSVNIEVDSF